MCTNSPTQKKHSDHLRTLLPVWALALGLSVYCWLSGADTAKLSLVVLIFAAGVTAAAVLLAYLQGRDPFPSARREGFSGESPSALLDTFARQCRDGASPQLLPTLKQMEALLPQLTQTEQQLFCEQALDIYLKHCKSLPDTGIQKTLYVIRQSLILQSADNSAEGQGYFSDLQAVLLDYVDRNCYDSGLCLNAAADYLNSSIYVVSRIFKDATGVGFKEYITGKRLQQACRLLETTSKTVSDVAAESGFENSTYFTTVFKNEYGIPPTKYRQNARNTGKNL